VKVLVTGGTGFIGSHAAEHLVHMGHEVTILRRSRSGSRCPPKSVRELHGDITHPGSLQRAFASQDVVIHAAGLVGSGGGSAYRRVNVDGTRNVIRAAIECRVPRLVHLSSLIVHAAPVRGALLHESSPLRERFAAWDHYGRSKREAEDIVRHARPRIDTIILRPGVVLGPRDRGVTPWVLRMLQHPYVPLVGRGDNRIPWVAVEELAEAVAVAGTSPGLASETFDLAGKVQLTQRELFEHHARALGRSRTVVSVPAAAARAGAWALDFLGMGGPRGAAPPWRMAVEIAAADATVDCPRAAAALGWRGSASCAETVRRAVGWERAVPTGAFPAAPGSGPQASAVAR